MIFFAPAVVLAQLVYGSQFLFAVRVLVERQILQLHLIESNRNIATQNGCGCVFNYGCVR